MVKFLNDYFRKWKHTIRGHNGIVLQYIGDEIEAVFGAPIEEPDHADKAVQAALEMRERLESLNDKRRSLGEEPIRHGIGMTHGRCSCRQCGKSPNASFTPWWETR